MDFSRLEEIATSLGVPTWDPATWLFVLLVTVLAVWGLSRVARRVKNSMPEGVDKKYPKKIFVFYDDRHIVLERRWLDGEWKYVLNSPIHFLSPEEEYNELNKNMRAPEEKWLANLDALTKEGGPMDQAIEKAYDKSAQTERGNLPSFFFRWRGRTPKIDLKAQQRENETRREEAMKPFSAETK